MPRKPRGEACFDVRRLAGLYPAAVIHTMHALGRIPFPSRLLRSYARLLYRWLISPRGPFRPCYPSIDNSHVILYTNNPSELQAYPRRKPLPSNPQFPPATLIATARNEIRSVHAWASSLKAQTHCPDEVIIVDGGSSDGTLEALQAFATSAQFPVIVMSKPGCNIAQGRNLAIAHARHEHIAVTDLGCCLDSNWLANILAPFADDPAIDVVAGWYEADTNGSHPGTGSWPELDTILPDSFLPSSRSLAFRKQAWREVGGYPEWLTLTGEDTLYAIELKRRGGRWAFVPSARVRWHAPRSARAYWQKVFGWASGDGESTLNSRLYWREFVQLAFWLGVPLLVGVAGMLMHIVLGTPLWIIALAALLPVLGFIGKATQASLGHAVWESGAKIARVLGFLRGASRRGEVNLRRRSSLRGVCAILAGVPFDDTGGGSRGSQLAKALLDSKWGVAYVHRFPRYETVDLGLRYDHPDLFLSPYARFRLETLTDQFPGLHRGMPLLAIVEFPLVDFLPTLEAIRQHGGIIAYDLLDNWRSSLGSNWYDPEIEDQVIQLADFLLATELSLQAHLQERTGREVLHLPNAVDAHLFDPQKTYERPDDLPHGDPILYYHGALWGAWFDWSLIAHICEQFPDAQLVLIGDYAGQCPYPVPRNLHFLGLKPQAALPAYLHHSDVALIPWLDTPITRATSPLKLYEYLAMRKPVIAPDLPPLRSIPGVLLSKDKNAFIENIRQARRIHLPHTELSEFIARNTWDARVELLLNHVGLAFESKREDPRV